MRFAEVEEKLPWRWPLQVLFFWAATWMTSHLRRGNVTPQLLWRMTSKRDRRVLQQRFRPFGLRLWLAQQASALEGFLSEPSGPKSWPVHDKCNNFFELSSYFLQQQPHKIYFTTPLNVLHFICFLQTLLCISFIPIKLSCHQVVIPFILSSPVFSMSKDDHIGRDLQVWLAVQPQTKAFPAVDCCTHGP